MSQRRRGARLVEEALARGGVQTSIFIHDLQGHVAMQHFVIRAINDTHASFANLCENAAMTENLADHKLLLFLLMLGCTRWSRQRTPALYPSPQLIPYHTRPPH